MTKEEFKDLYEDFLKRVIKFAPIAPYIQNQLFEVYKYLTTDEVRLVFNQFYREIEAGRILTGVEPTVLNWDKIVWFLYLDKIYKKGHRLKPVTETGRKEVGRMAAGMIELLSGSGGDNISCGIDKIVQNEKG